jgi:biopolymer transport protein ExbB/TolQ
MDFSLSPMTLFQQAGPVGKAVMLILLAASIWCWVAAIEIMASLRAARRSARSLAALADAPKVAASVALRIEGETGGERRARVADVIAALAGAPLRRAARALSSLTVVAGVSPFIGLFGTVWGVMTSFAGVAQTQETSLAVVAPGVAEALAATAYGLAAAIPAAFLYAKLNAALVDAEASLVEMAGEIAAAIVARPRQRSSEARDAA